jgi:phosphopantothenoylcysteine decarboxylase
MLQIIHRDEDSHHGSLTRTSPAFVAAAHAHDGKHHLLLAASGSVAAIKIPNILAALADHPSLSVRLILTPSATCFLNGQSSEQPTLASLLDIPNVDGLFLDEAEWAVPWKRGNPILHIELRRWAHMLVIAPLSANTLAKIVGGFADSLLTSVVRAWDTTGFIDDEGEAVASVVSASPQPRRRKIIIVAPSMNTAMWKHPITKTQIRVLEEDWGIREAKPAGVHVGEDEGEGEGWFEVLRPMEKELACGDVGSGAMKDWREIVEVIESRLGL